MCLLPEVPQPPAGELSDAERTADSKTDKKRKVKAITPENPDVAKLAKKIKKELPKGGTMIDVARDFANGNETKAQSLLRQLRSDRYRNLLG